MKTTVLKFFTLSVAIFAFSTISFGQNTDNTTASAGARIVTPLTIKNDGALEFGDIISASDENVVTISPAGARTATTPEALLVTASRTPQAAQFTVAGEASLGYTVLISESITLTGATTSETMTVDNFVHNANGTLIATETTGKETFSVGADLTVEASQASDIYTGSFTVTVTYE